MNLYILKIPKGIIWNKLEKYVSHISKERATKIEKYIKCITQTVCCNIDADDVIISASSNDTNLNMKIQELSFEKVLENFENIR